MSKYKYYFRKPKSELTKDVFRLILIGGMAVIAAASPYFIVNIMKAFKKLKKYPNKKVYDTFYNLKKQGLINFYTKNNQIYISLTKEGKNKAGWMQIDDLKIRKLKKWDGKWRILLFDIAEMKRTYREALRGKLKDLNFHLFQKSAWISPYDYQDEVGLLKSFFGLNNKELKFIVAKDIGDDAELRKYFKL